MDNRLESPILKNIKSYRALSRGASVYVRVEGIDTRKPLENPRKPFDLPEDPQGNMCISHTNFCNLYLYLFYN